MCDVEPADVNVPAAALNCCSRQANFTNSNDSSGSLRVVLYETREGNEIGLHGVHTSLVFSGRLDFYWFNVKVFITLINLM